MFGLANLRTAGRVMTAAGVTPTTISPWRGKQASACGRRTRQRGRSGWRSSFQICVTLPPHLAPAVTGTPLSAFRARRATSPTTAAGTRCSRGPRKRLGPRAVRGTRCWPKHSGTLGSVAGCETISRERSARRGGSGCRAGACLPPSRQVRQTLMAAALYSGDVAAAVHWGGEMVAVSEDGGVPWLRSMARSVVAIIEFFVDLGSHCGSLERPGHG